jgi:hypothetical protein
MKQPKQNKARTPQSKQAKNPLFTCPMCSGTFKRESALTMHMRYRHAKAPQAAEAGNKALPGEATPPHALLQTALDQLI